MNILIFGELEEQEQQKKVRPQRCCNCGHFRQNKWICAVGYVQDADNDTGNFARHCVLFEQVILEKTDKSDERFCKNCIAYTYGYHKMCYFGYPPDLVEDKYNRANSCRYFSPSYYGRTK